MKRKKKTPDPDTRLSLPMRQVEIQDAWDDDEEDEDDGQDDTAEALVAQSAGKISMALAKICPDFIKWPARWMGDEADLVYGRGLLAAMRPFAEHLAGSQLAPGTIRRHLEYLWLLGGEIIREVSMYEKHDKISPANKLAEAVDRDGGPLCCDLTESEQRSFDATCRKLHAFLKDGGNDR